MTTLKQLIKKLQNMEEKHGGDTVINIYNSFNKETKNIDIDQIYYDDKLKDVYIGIYN